MKTVAKTILEMKSGYSDRLLLANKFYSDNNQDWDNETTIFYFKDGSWLKFCAIDLSVEEEVYTK